MVVMSIFLLGLDGDTPEYLRNLPDLVDAVGVDIPVYSLAAPIEQTPFARELAQDGRLLPGDRLDGMDGVHLVYRPRRVRADELESSLFDCMLRSYERGRVARRVVRRFRNGFWSGVAGGLYNGFYRRYQRSLAQTGRSRVGLRGPWEQPAAGREPGWLGDSERLPLRTS
jgi:hypothetical protein